MKKSKQQELFEDIRAAATKGRKLLVEDSPKYLLEIEKAKFDYLLAEVEKSETLNEISVLLDSESIPLELLFIDKFWGRFQELVDSLPPIV